MRRVLPLLLVLTACTPTFDLTPERAGGATGTATFTLLSQALIAMDGHEMSTTMTGSLDLSIAPGAFGDDAIAITATHRGLEMTRQALGQTHLLTTAGEIPDTLQAAFAHEDTPRITTIAVDRSMVIERNTTLGSDADVLMDTILWAPTDRIEVGHVWGRPVGAPAEDGVQWYRSYTLTSVRDGIATLRFVHRQNDPIAGSEGPEHRQINGLQKVDIATGLPYNMRMRSLARGAVGEDTWTTFTWPGLQTIEP
ncbi:MAG: hypothetical protein ACJATT_000436 [Myxococcota bacterium]